MPSKSPVAFARHERSWLVPATLIVIVALTLGIVGIIVGQTDVGHDIFGGGAKTATTLASQPLRVLTPQAFDPPPGDGIEHDESLANLVDGKPDTSWNTQTYDSPQFGGVKSGVGVVLPLAAATSIRSITVDSPTSGWKASIYLADSAKPRDSLAAWGQPVATLSGAGTSALKGKTAGAVLVWITDLGPSDRVVISEIRLTH